MSATGREPGAVGEGGVFRLDEEIAGIKEPMKRLERQAQSLQGRL